MNAVYTITKVTDVCVILKDDFNPENPTKSVTNDAERVTAEVNRLHPAKRIFYYDTEGALDELVHDKGKFIRFAPFDNIRPV
jgi:hypothetical protein